jgi:hypothetical protein
MEAAADVMASSCQVAKTAFGSLIARSAGSRASIGCGAGTGS